MHSITTLGLLTLCITGPLITSSHQIPEAPCQKPAKLCSGASHAINITGPTLWRRLCFGVRSPRVTLNFAPRRVRIGARPPGGMTGSRSVRRTAAKLNQSRLQLEVSNTES